MKILHVVSRGPVAFALALTFLMVSVTAPAAFASQGTSSGEEVTAWPPKPSLKKLVSKKKAVAPLDDKNQELADRLKAALDGFAPVNSYRKEVKVSELEAAAANMKATKEIISEAKSSIKRMDHNARGHVKVKPLREKLKEVTDYYSEANSNFKSVQEAEEERARAEAEALQQERRKYTEAARRFFMEYEGLHRLSHWARFSTDEGARDFEGSIGIYTESDITKAQALGELARTACSTPSFVAADKETYLLADALVADEYCTADSKDCTRIGDLCAMAKPENLNPSLTRAYLRTLEESTAARVKKVEERIAAVEKGNGFLDYRNFMNVMRHLNGGKWSVNANTEVFDNDVKRVAGYFEMLGAEMPEAGPFPALNEANKRLGEAVEAQIGSWGRWPEDGKFKESRAAKAVKGGLGKSEKAIKVGMWQENWKINKNGMGVTISRHKHGYVISRVKGDKHCQLASFKYEEPYVANGKFQKKGNVGYDGLTKPVTCK